MTIQGFIQALVISLIILFMFGDGNQTISTILDALKQSEVDAWQIATISFPVIFVACTTVQLITYIFKRTRK